MADSYYTSYETSVALRDAGAPQMDGEKYWGAYIGGGNRLRNDPAYTGSDNDRAQYPRAFRADEIIEALGHRFGGTSVYRSNLGEVWTIELKGKTLGTSGPLVEALAAAWLAVLKEGK